MSSLRELAPKVRRTLQAQTAFNILEVIFVCINILLTLNQDGLL